MKEMLHLITEPLKRAPFPNEQTETVHDRCSHGFARSFGHGWHHLPASHIHASWDIAS